MAQHISSQQGQKTHEQEKVNLVSHLPQWGGDIEKTSFDQVIFSGCGEIFKKGIGWDGKSSWMIFDRKDGIFQWVLTERKPLLDEFGYKMSVPMMNVRDLWWNFKMGEFIWDENDVREDNTIYAQVKIFSGQWNGSWSHVPYQWNLLWDGKGLEVESEGFQGDYIPYAIHDRDYEFYNKAYPLNELPIYDPRQNTWEDHEGWTHCLEEPDWVEDMLSYDSPEEGQEEDEKGHEEEQLEDGEIREDVPKKDNMEDLKRKKAEAEERARGLFQEVEVREDPFDGELYTKKEFLDYYGTTLQWDFMSEEKTFKRGVLGKWILDNGSYMRPEATNYLLDKMIETFL